MFMIGFAQTCLTVTKFLLYNPRGIVPTPCLANFFSSDGITEFFDLHYLERTQLQFMAHRHIRKYGQADIDRPKLAFNYERSLIGLLVVKPGYIENLINYLHF